MLIPLAESLLMVGASTSIILLVMIGSVGGIGTQYNGPLFLSKMLPGNDISEAPNHSEALIMIGSL